VHDADRDVLLLFLAKDLLFSACCFCHKLVSGSESVVSGQWLIRN
jgi:hypothetical protein